MLLVALVGSHNHGLFLSFGLRVDLSLVEQEAQLLHGILAHFLRGVAKFLLAGKTKCPHEDIHFLFKRRNFLTRA